MEVIYHILPQQWAFEKTTGQQVTQPTEADLIPAINPETNEPATDPETGEPLLRLRLDFEQVTQEVELDTVIVVDRGGESVFKIVLGNTLPSFLAHYVQFLDTDGRQLLRSALQETSGIVPVTFEAPNLQVLPGGRTPPR